MTMTPSQQRAIDTNSSAVLVVAGAGSGKTTVVTHRIARLINDGCDPTRILVLTFTRKAANELRERLAKLVGAPAAKTMWVGTFHAISYRILAEHGHRIGYQTSGQNRISIVTTDEADELMAEVASECRWMGTKKDIAEARKALAHDGLFPIDENLARLIREYWVRLRECNAMDYDQLLLEVARLFRDAPDVLALYHDLFEHIFVDEYQDTDHVQYNLHEAINPENLFCVGDPRQAIYGWRGADVSIILGFETAHPGAEVIDLLENFRSGSAIVEAANNVIGHNPEGTKGLLPTIVGGSVSVRQGDPSDVSCYIWNDLGSQPCREIAVIARTHATLEAVEKECEWKHIGCNRVGAGGGGVEAGDAWRTFHAVIRCATNSRDSIAFRTVAAKWLKLLPDAVYRLRLSAIQAGRSVVDMHLAVVPDGSLAGISRTAKDNDYSVVDVLNGFSIEAVERGVFEQSSLDPVRDRIRELGGDDMTCAEWLTWLQTKDMHADLERDSRPRITLLTAHAAKGLEWDHVIVADFNERVFPSSRAVREGHEHEERRLAYVAATRARKTLTVFDNYRVGAPSRFIGEMGLKQNNKEASE